jgi:hypothetical protein
MSITENNILTLAELLDQYDAGTLNMDVLARKCYMTEKEKHFKRISWIHNDELKNQSLLRGMAKNGAKDLLRQTKEKL